MMDIGTDTAAKYTVFSAFPNPSPDDFVRSDSDLPQHTEVTLVDHIQRPKEGCNEGIDKQNN